MRRLYIVRQSGQNCSILGRTFKVQKTLEKQLHNHINFFYAKKKPLKRRYFKIDTIWRSGKNGHFARATVGQNGERWPILGRTRVNKANNKKHSKNTSRTMANSSNIRKMTRFSKGYSTAKWSNLKWKKRGNKGQQRRIKKMNKGLDITRRKQEKLLSLK